MHLCVRSHSMRVAHSVNWWMGTTALLCHRALWDASFFSFGFWRWSSKSDSRIHLACAPVVQSTQVWANNHGIYSMWVHQCPPFVSYINIMCYTFESSPSPLSSAMTFSFLLNVCRMNKTHKGLCSELPQQHLRGWQERFSKMAEISADMIMQFEDHWPGLTQDLTVHKESITNGADNPVLWT